MKPAMAVMEEFERCLSEEFSKLNYHITEEFSRLDQRIAEEVSRLEQKITEVQANLIKWMVIFWIGQIAVIGGMLFAMLRLAIK